MHTKTIILFALLFLFLTACGMIDSAEMPPTSTIHATPKPSLTPTVTSSVTPTLVTPTISPTPIPARESSIRYPAETISAFVGQVQAADGDVLEIPIYIGMTRGVVENQDNPIIGLEMKPEVVDALAEYWLYVNYYRYLSQSGFEGSYENYLGLLVQGKAGVDMLSWDLDKAIGIAVRTVNPLMGFSITWTDEENMTVASPAWGFSFEVDQGGRFHGSTNYYLLYGEHLESMVAENGPTMEIFEQEYDTVALFEGSFVIETLEKLFTLYGDTDFECMLGGNVTRDCGVQFTSEDFEQLSDLLDANMMAAAIVGAIDELILIVRP